MEESKPGAESSLKDILAELGLKDLHLKGQNLEVDPEFAARLDEVCHSLFESPHLTATFASELKYGFGHAMGYKMVDWIWEQLTPGLKPTGVAKEASQLTVRLQTSHREEVSRLIRKSALEFNSQTGVLLPSVNFEEGESFQVLWRNVELVSFPAYPVARKDEDIFLSSLVKNAWRLLSVQQVQERLHKLWTRRPELHQAFLHDGMGVMAVLRFLRDLLKAGYSIREFDLIVETVVLYRPFDLASLDSEAKEDLLSVLPSTQTRQRSQGLPSATNVSEQKEEPSVYEMATVDRVELSVGRALLDLVDPREGAKLLERVTSLRRNLAKEMGWITPGVRFRDDLNLGIQEFRICVRGVEKARGTIYPHCYLALGPPDRLEKIRGIDAVDPTYQMNGKWVEPEERDECERVGCAIFEAVSVMGMCLASVLRKEAHRLFSHQDLFDILKNLSEESGQLCEFIGDSPALFRQAKTVISRLLQEQVPIIDMTAIFETILELEESNLSAYFLSERIRETLGPLVCRDHVRSDNDLYAFTLSDEVTELCQDCLQIDAKGACLKPGAEFGEELVFNVRETIQELMDEGHKAILVTQPRLRRPLRDFLFEYLPELVVLSEKEIQGVHNLVILTEVPIRVLPPRVVKHRPRPRELRPGPRFKKVRRRP